MIATAPLIARSLHVPAATWAFAALGAVAALRGFENLGVKSMLRANQFSPEASVIAVSQVALLVVTVAAAWWTGRYDCILWGMLAQTIAVVGLSHMVSPRRWRLGFNRVVITEALRFGRPLLIGGAAASVATSDRLIVGAVLGPAAIAVYNVAVGSAMLPRSVMARFVTSALVPLFSRKSMHADKVAPLADAWAFGLSCTALVYGLAIALAGGPVLGAVFGPVYQPSQLFMTILGLAVCIRILMLLPVPPALARGDASLVTLASIAPAIAVLLATPILIVTRDPSSFLLTSSIVELLALFWLTRKIAVRLSFSPAPLRLLAIGPPVTLTVLVIATLLAPDNSTSYAVIICSIALVIVTGAYLTIHRRYGIQLSAALP